MLSSENLKLLKVKLQEEKKSLETEIENLHADRPPEMGTDIDHFDEEADEAEEFTTNIGIANALKERLQEIGAALQKLERNEYGHCEKCGGEIELELLKVNPESRLCQKCKKAQ
ncbi:MAG: hypothetical protein HY456_03225 [Parcubacteria group bacterium]|nr:hypothetical protein [Parcubacteria group bacterium]